MTAFFAAAAAFLKTVPTMAWAIGISFLLGNLSCHAWNTRHHLFGPKPPVIYGESWDIGGYPHKQSVEPPVSK